MNASTRLFWLGYWANGKTGRLLEGLFGILVRLKTSTTFWTTHIDLLRTYFSCVSPVHFSQGILSLYFRFWIEISKETPRAIAKQVREQGLTLPSYRTESVYSVLNKYIPTAAMLGGITIGLLNILGDVVNATGSSTGILLSVSILYKFY